MCVDLAIKGANVRFFRWMRSQNSSLKRRFFAVDSGRKNGVVGQKDGGAEKW
jgi:hypothetical protein